MYFLEHIFSTFLNEWIYERETINHEEIPGAVFEKSFLRFDSAKTFFSDSEEVWHLHTTTMSILRCIKSEIQIKLIPKIIRKKDDMNIN